MTDKDRIAAVQWFAGVGERHKQAYFSHLSIEKLRSDRYYGLRAFFFAWAFERAGAPRGFRIAAVKAVSDLEAGKGDLAESFSRLFKGKCNSRNNPALDERAMDLDVPSIVALVEEGRVQEAFLKITLNGIGHKIRALFLRDLVTITGSERQMVKMGGDDCYLYCQPVDVWVRAVAGALGAYGGSAPKAGKLGLSAADRTAAWGLILLAKQASVSPLRVNQGIWHFCANAVGDTERLSTVLKDPNITKALDTEFRLMSGFLPERSAWG